MSQGVQWPCVGTYVDCKDKDGGDWQVGYVLSRQKNIAKIRSEGWASKYDETYILPSNRIRPFRNIVKGYTGQVKNPAPRDHWKFTQQNHQQRLQKFKSIIQSEPKTQEEWLQYIRGQHFFYLDFLLCNTYSTSKQLLSIYEYFRQHLIFAKQYIEKMIAAGVYEFFKEKSDSNKAFYEVLDGILILSGVYQRHHTFLKNNSKLFEEIEENLTHEKSIVRLISQIKLDQAYLNLVHLILDRKEEQSLPFGFYYVFVRMYQIIDKSLILFKEIPFDNIKSNKQQRKKIALNLLAIINRKLEKSCANQIKNPKIDTQFENLMSDMKTLYFRLSLENAAYEWIEQTRTRYNILMIKTPVLDLKLKGLTKLKDLFEDLQPNKQNILYKLPINKFMQVLAEQSLLSVIFAQNEHPQVLKRGAQLWVLLLRYNAVKPTDILFIWQNCIQKHETVRKIVLQLWIDLVSSSTKCIGLLVKTISSQCRQNDKILKQIWEIQMLFTFIHSSFIIFQETPQQIPQKKQLQLELLLTGHQKMLEAYKSENGKNFIAEFAKFINYSSQSNQIIKRCYQQLIKGVHFEQNILLLTNFYNESTEPTTFVASNTLKIILMVLEKNQEYAEILFNFLTEVVKFASNHASVSLFGLQQFQQLWKISQNEKIKPFFNNWILPKSGYGAFRQSILEVNNIIDHELRSIIFTKFLCDHQKLDYINMQLQQFYIFRQFLFLENQQADKLDITVLIGASKIISIKDSEIIGSKNVWDIFLNCKNMQVLKEVNKLLITLHLHFNSNLDLVQRKKRINAFMTRLEKHLLDGFKKGNQRIVKCVLALIKDTLDYLKEKTLEYQIKYQLMDKVGTIKIQFGEKQLEIMLNYDRSIKQLKNKISQKLKIPYHKLRLTTIKGLQLGHHFGYVPYCSMYDRVIKLQIVEEQQLITVINDFIKLKLEGILIDIMEDPTISQNVYHVFEQIDTTQGEGLINKISKSIIKQSQNRKDSPLCQNQIYFYLLFFKALGNQLDKPLFLKIINNNSLVNIIFQLFGSALDSQLKVLLVATNCDLLSKIIKKIMISQDFKILTERLKETFEKCIQQLHYLADSLQGDSIQSVQQIRLKKIKIVFTCLIILEEINKKDLFVELHQHQMFYSIIQKIFLNKEIYQMRLIFAQKLKKCAKKAIQISPFSWQVQNLIGKMYFVNLYPLVKCKDGFFSQNQKTLNFYSYIEFFIRNLSNRFFKQFIQDNKFYQAERQALKQLSDSQNLSEKTNILLKAHLDIFAAMIQKDSTILLNEDINFILYECLIYEQGITNRKEVRCRHDKTIQSALNILHLSINSNKEKMSQILPKINHFMKMMYWRSSQFWNVSTETKVKGQFIGLQNPGCICYMNSFLQQLFMFKPFRNCIINTNVTKNSEQIKVDIIKQLKQLFLGLTYSEQPALSAVPFSKTIKGSDGKPMLKIFIQMDIDQFSSILFDRLEKQLRLSNNEDYVRNLFGGVYAHQIISSQCPHSSQREEEFLSVGLEVKNHINESFSCLVRGQILDGENKYHCQKCDKKVKAQKMLTIKKLPECLIIALKRFEYNYEIDAKIKKNDYCQFPQELNLIEYSKQHINAQKLKQVSKEQQVLPEEHFLYRLKGVVVHTGSADSGHYYSYIKTEEEKWIQFNDSSVSEFNVQNLADQAFGTKDSMDQKARNAYLLIYERKKQQNVSKIQEKQQIKQENKIMINNIFKSNKQTSIFRLLFSDQYYEFIQKIILKMEKLDQKDNVKQIISSFVVNYYLLIKLRSSQPAKFLTFTKKIQKLLLSNTFMRHYFIEVVINFNFLEEIFVYCADRIRSKIFSRFLINILKKYYEERTLNQSEGEDFIEKLIILAKHLSVLHGAIGDLNYILKKICALSINEQNQKYIDSIIQHKIQNFIAISLLNLAIPKVQTEFSVKFKQESRLNYNKCIGLSFNQGRKYVSSEKLQKFTFLAQLLEYLKRKQQVKQLNQIKDYFAKQMKQLLTFNKIFEGQDSLTIYWAFECLKHLDLLEQLLFCVQKGLKDFESTKYRQLLLIVYFYLKEKGSEDESVQNIIEMLERVFEINQKYFLQINLILQWMVKIVTENTLFLNNLRKAAFIEKINNWIPKNKLPSDELLKKHKNPQHERMMNRLHGILVSKDQKQYERKSTQLQLYFLTVNKQVSREQDNNCNWKLQFNMDYNVGMSVKVFDIVTGIWKKGIVISMEYDNLIVKCQKQAIQIWIDNERLCPYVEQIKEVKEEPAKVIPSEDPIEQNLYD